MNPTVVTSGLSQRFGARQALLALDLDLLAGARLADQRRRKAAL